MARKQELDWGSIDWIFEPGEGSLDSMRVGISTMRPGTMQPRHIHYGDEQLMYVISGHGSQWIGDEETPLRPGAVYHISSGMSHESVNDGGEPIVKLLISIPALTETPKVRMNESERVRRQETIDKPEFLRDTVRELFRSMLAPLKVPLAIFDQNYELVYRSLEYPEYCRTVCHVDEDWQNCEILKQACYWGPPQYEGASGNVCAHGLWLYTLPVESRGELLGYIKAGHVRTAGAERGRDGTPLPYNVPESTVRGIVEVIHHIAEAIVNHYQICLMQVTRQRNIRMLSDQKSLDALLKESLKTTQDQAFNLQISQHFLFNTLSTIAGMAIRENAISTYDAVCDLSQLLRYTLRTNRFFVDLSEEIDYLKKYTNLQKIRFGDHLEVTCEAPQELMDCKVPFHFLQPVAENAFKHGFKDRTGVMKLDVAVREQGETLTLTVRDNGSGMSPEALEGLREKIRTGSGERGTSMVVRKLASMYGENFSYTVTSDEHGTCVTIRIPSSEYQEA